MQSDRWQQVTDLFDAAAEMTEPERTRFLQEECAGDHELLAEIESLLASHEQASQFIEQSIATVPLEVFSETRNDRSGEQFGTYRIIREIGRGGLGTVYLAERADDEYRKEVALKLVRRGLDTEDILRRFRHERQILAQLDHPNIAGLLDGGTSDDGRPYFVMEYVKGETIGAYCERRSLDLRVRLELFRKVCAAVTYAHQNLVIHRDLKPSNILVTPEGEPKLLDFGIAKLLTADANAFTETIPTLRVLTPDYASPEQIRGEKITTASDVYSLGVLLYELLSGEKPYRLKTGTSDELTRAIAEQEPARPKSLSGDLANIVTMAMRKETTRRYASVEQMSADILRYLEQRPVIARRDTLAYRAGKFVRRNKVGVLAAVLVISAIFAGMIATLWESHLARRERARAEGRFNDVRKLANSNLFEVYPEVENLEGSLKAREAILKNTLTYLDSLAKEAHGDPDLQSELATAYEKVGDVQGALNTSNLGKIEAALDSYAKGRALRASVFEQRPNDVAAKDRLANNYYIAARTLWNDGQTKRAEETFEQGLKLRRELVASQPASVEYKNRLATLLIDYGAIPTFNAETEKALTLFNEALVIIRELRERDPQNSDFKKTRARVLRIYSKALGKNGDYAGGQEALAEALTLSRELAQEFPQDFRMQRSVWLTQNVICELLIDKGDSPRAVAGCEGTIEFPKTALAHEPENSVVAYDLAISYFDIARAHRLAGNFPETIEQAQRAVEVMSALSAKSPGNTEYQRNLAVYRTEAARAEIALGRADEALATLEEVRAILRPIAAASPKEFTYQSDLASAQRLSAQALHQRGDNAQALEVIGKAIAIFQQLREAKAIPDADKGLLAELEQERAEYAK